MARAEKIASRVLDSPDKKSPEMVSLMALVMATPGTKDIMEAIIMVSMFSPMPNLTDRMDKILARAAPINLFKKKVILYSVNLLINIKTIRLTM